MTELRHLQLVILDIMKDIDTLCKEYGIEYYLLGGSAIGAIRHKGFIPWDDDLDIVMDSKNYNKFIAVCKAGGLDQSKYSLRVGFEDWPLSFSKVHLKGTKFEEIEGFSDAMLKGLDGIFVDIFRLDNVSSNKMMARWQYLCGKYFLCYQLLERSYKSASFKKKIMMYLSYPLKMSFLRTFVRNQVERYNNQETEYVGLFYGRTRYKNTITKRSVFGKPTYVPFEDTQLCVAEHYHEYLTQMFGDYMKLPPKDQQKGLHLISVDFGNY